MHTLKIKVSDRVYDKFKSYIDEFDKEDFEILSENEKFYDVKNFLDKELQKVKDGTAKYYTVDELDKRLDKIIDEN